MTPRTPPFPTPSRQGENAEDSDFFRRGGGGLPSEGAGCGCHPALYIGIGVGSGADSEKGRSNPVEPSLPALS